TFMAALDRDGLIRSQEDFSYYANQIFSVLPGFRTISVTTPEYTLTYQFPLLNLVHDLRAYPDRMKFADKARETRRLTVTDPLHLSSDNRLGFAVYVPVFAGEDFKGLIVGTFDINQMTEKSLKPIFGGVPFRISTQRGEFFYATPDAQTINPGHDLVVDVRLGDNAWKIYTPLLLHPIVYDHVILLVSFVLVSTVCLSLLYLFQTQRVENQEEALHIFESNYRAV